MSYAIVVVLGLVGRRDFAGFMSIREIVAGEVGQHKCKLHIKIKSAVRLAPVHLLDAA